MVAFQDNSDSKGRIRTKKAKIDLKFIQYNSLQIREVNVNAIIKLQM